MEYEVGKRVIGKKGDNINKTGTILSILPSASSYGRTQLTLKIEWDRSTAEIKAKTQPKVECLNSTHVWLQVKADTAQNNGEDSTSDVEPGEEAEDENDSIDLQEKKNILQGDELEDNLKEKKMNGKKASMRCVLFLSNGLL